MASNLADLDNDMTFWSTEVGKSEEVTPNGTPLAVMRRQSCGSIASFSEKEEKFSATVLRPKKYAPRCLPIPVTLGRLRLFVTQQ